MRRRVFNWSTRLIGAGLGIWVAALLLPGLNLHGPPARQALAVLIAAVIMVIGTVLIPAPAYRLLRVAMTRARQRLDNEDDGLVDPIFQIGALQAVNAALGIAVWALVAPVAIWLAAQTGPGITLDRPATAVIGAIIVVATWPLVRIPFYRRRPLALELATVVLTTGALWLAVALLAGVRLEPGPGRLQALTMVVLALMYYLVWFHLTAPYVTVLFRLLMAGLKLWALSWLSGWVLTPLRIEGFWSFVLTALIVIVATWPLLVAERSRQPAYDPYLDDPLRHLEIHQQMMSRPIY